ncbi:MAG: metallophosphoesterase [Ekhidna sp.]|nr:metallophosphoesterase [Ekhidna sp.]
MGRTLVMGDIHGNLKALRECLKKSSFDAQEDVLIQLGDVSDRGPDTAEVVELLLSIPRLIAIKGNHDLWTSEWIAEDRRNPVWLSNGGLETIKSYKDSGIDKSKHKNFFESQILYHVDDNNRIYVHGGFTDP